MYESPESKVLFSLVAVAETSSQIVTTTHSTSVSDELPPDATLEE